MVALYQFACLIFSDAWINTHYVLYSLAYSAGLIFAVRQSSTKIWSLLYDIFTLSLLLTQGIIVKVLHEKLGDHFYRKKGIVEEVRDTFIGVVKMIETGDKIKIDQAHLETVIPAIGMNWVNVATCSFVIPSRQYIILS